MSENKETLVESIEGGSFFKDGRDWYSLKIISPITERSFFIVITVSSLFTMITSLFALYSIMPLTREIPFVVYIDNMAEDVPILSRLSDRDELYPDKHVVNQLVYNYIIAWEGYTFEDLNKNRDAVMQFSSPEISEYYQNIRSVRNPDSHIMLYKQHTIRTINVYYIESAIDDGRPRTTREVINATMQNLFSNDNKENREKTHESTIVFEATEKNILGSKSSLWQAKIMFKYTPIQFNKDEGDFNPLDFKVIKYEVTPMEQQTTQ